MIKSEVSRAKVIAELTCELLSVLGEDNEGVIAEYSKNMMLTGRSVYYTLGNEHLQGTVDGIDATGGLIVIDAFGERSILRSGEVSLERF